MSVRNLEALFAPRSLAVLGASDQPATLGSLVMASLARAGFPGPVWPVNPKHATVAGAKAFRDVASLPGVPDLAVVATPSATIPALLGELGARGTRAAVVLSATPMGEAGRALERELLAAARPHGLRILGPNCLGLLVPGARLDASFAHVGAARGGLAFVSQSGALCTAVLDWAESRSIGFSAVVSLGNGIDVDAGDALDWLGADPETRAILLYLEEISHARKFMSAGRAAARNKPVVVIKSGRGAPGARAAASHTGAMAGADDVCDAAFRRAGMLRVDEIDELFEAAETLGRGRLPPGDRVAIVSNGGGPGVLATDALVAGGAQLADLGPETLRRLDALLPPTWSRANPVDLIGDAPGSRYAEALAVLLEDRAIDALLVLHAPTAIASSLDAARAVAFAVRALHAERRVLTSWLGGSRAEPARRALRDAGLATYETPGDAVRAFLHLLRHRRSQEQLMETPPSLPAEPASDGAARAAARATIASVLAEGRELLTEAEAKRVLAAWGIAVVETRVARGADEAAGEAARLGFPVALKVVSPEVTHKSDVGGVALALGSAEAVRAAAAAMAVRLRELRPEARLAGFAVQPMVRRDGAHELIVGVSTDPVFGPVILFGQGGTAVELIDDRALALPPLNLALAHQLVAQTRVARLLSGHRGQPAADRAALAHCLVRVSELVLDVPELVELDVNPLLLGPGGALALDARMRVAAGGRSAGLAIRPYPSELEELLHLPDGRTVLARPIRPEDEPAHLAFFEKLSAEDVYFRFFNLVRRMPHSQLARYTQIDYDREMAFIAHAPGERETLGVVRAVFDPDQEQAEFAIVVRSDLKGRGLGHALLEKLVRYCRERGAREMVGQILPDNRAMLALAAEIGFRTRRLPDGVVEARLPL
jgi:acetyltransferase